MVTGDPGDLGVYASNGQDKDINTDIAITQGLEMVVPHAQDYIEIQQTVSAVNITFRTRTSLKDV